MGRLQPCRALESYMVDKLNAAGATYREMQLRMGDPDVAADAAEFQKVAKAAADLEATATSYAEYQDVEKQLADAQAYLKEVRASESDCTV